MVDVVEVVVGPGGPPGAAGAHAADTANAVMAGSSNAQSGFFIVVSVSGAVLHPVLSPRARSEWFSFCALGLLQGAGACTSNVRVSMPDDFVTPVELDVAVASTLTR